MSHDDTRGRRPWSLRRMLLASIAFHVLLLLLFRWLPASSPVERPTDEIEVRFDLSEPPRSELFRPSDPLEERPAEAPVDPAPSSRGAVVPAPAPVPAPPAPVRRPTPERVEPAEVDRPEPEDAARETETQDAAESADDRGVTLPGERPDLREGGSERPRERLDIGRAIRDYASNPPQVTRPPEPETPETPGTPKGMELPDLERLPSTGFGMDRNLMFESSDYDWSDYTRQIYMAIWRAWHNRLYQTTAAFDRWAYEQGSTVLDHQVLIQFTIHRTGEVTEIFVVTPSGCVPLDASAADAMAEVILPRLPDDFPRDRERVRGRFIATGDVRNMKRILGYMKEAGWF